MANPKALEKPAAARGVAKSQAKLSSLARNVGRSVKAAPAQEIAGLVAADSTRLYRFDPQARIAVIRQGIPASTISSLSSRLGMSKETLLSSLGLSRATISRKEKDATVLSKDESERVLSVENLIDLVQNMVEQSGDPSGFNAARWLSDWLTRPLPALAGATPASYMDTFEGQKLVAELLSMSQSGAYA
jgi:putative toxin-antitoxin system antitoxin component (TIGR02293 family)